MQGRLRGDATAPRRALACLLLTALVLALLPGLHRAHARPGGSRHAAVVAASSVDTTAGTARTDTPTAVTASAVLGCGLTRSAGTSDACGLVRSHTADTAQVRGPPVEAAV